MNSEEKWDVVDDWQWDALSGTMQEYIILLGKERDDLLVALEPFAYLAEVMEEGQVLNFRGVYVTWEQAGAARVAIAKARGESNE